VTSKLIEEVEKLRPKPGDTGYLAGSARVADVVDQVIALIRQHGEQSAVEARSSEREAAHAAAEAIIASEGTKYPMQRFVAEKYAQVALAADPLRRRLGPVAVQAIVDGKATVVHSFQPGRWMPYKIQYVDESGSDWEIDSGECRLDILREER
jgi:hypothetical protein